MGSLDPEMIATDECHPRGSSGNLARTMRPSDISTHLIVFFFKDSLKEVLLPLFKILDLVTL